MYVTSYTDGSKDGGRVASGAILGDEAPIATLRLPLQASIFTAETRAILLALKRITISNKTKFIIFSDSLSCLQSIHNRNIKNRLVYQILYIIKILNTLGKEIVFLWVPSHVGIHGNSVVDRIAKEALNEPLSNSKVPFTDFKPSIRKYVFKMWEDCWSELENNKLHDIKPQLGEDKVFYRTRRDQVVMTRCRIGHSRLTHEYHLKKEPRPECVPCDCQFTVKHFLLDCVDFSDIRKKYFNCSTMSELFKLTPIDNIINYLKEIGLYNKI